MAEDLLFKTAIDCTVNGLAAYEGALVVDHGGHEQKVERADFLEVEPVLFTFRTEGLVVFHAAQALLHFNPLELHFEQFEFLFWLGPLGDGNCVFRGHLFKVFN